VCGENVNPMVTEQHGNPSAGFPSGLSSSRFAIKTLYAFLFSPMRATCPHCILINLIILIIWRGVQITKLLIM
jgi:hypothetical protein